MKFEEALNSRDERVSDFSIESDHSLDSDFDIAAVHLTAAEATRVELPRGQRIVAVPVAPGETIELPTDSQQSLLAELGPQGNLAIVVDGRTIILQGYAEASEQAPVTIVTDDGERIDVSAVIAATDPSLEIQTAAGPAAGSQGNVATGSGIFVPFPEDSPLGGFAAEGVLAGTALSYKLISSEAKFLDLNEDQRGRDGGGEIGHSVPTADPDSVTVTQATATNYQLMVVIDVSGSMAEEVTRPDGTITTRMDLQKAAVIGMLESYAAAASGFVNIKMVQFASDASYFGGTSPSEFVDITDPAALAAVIAEIKALSPTSNTDYDTALATAQQGIMDPSWATTTPLTKGLVYFFSDGEPINDGDGASSYPGGSKANSLNQTEEDIWEGRTSAGAFASGLADKGVVSIAVGLGADIAGKDKALEQLGRVAYTSETFPDQSVIVVNDENQLTSEIIKTVPATVTGNVLSNDEPGSDGYDHPAIVSVAAIIDSDTTMQVVTDTATGYKVETNNGVLVIDKTTGEFSYTAAPGSGGHEDTFTYTIRDALDDDTASATLTVHIAPPSMATGTTPFEGTTGHDFIIGDDADNIISAAAGTDAVQGGFGDDRIDGGSGNDFLHGQEGNDTLLGGAGNDALFGSNSDDVINGGSGIDVLSGGAGNDRLDGGLDSDADTLSGGLGDDTLVWRGTDDTYSGGADQFNAATGAAGDVLDASGATLIDLTKIDNGRITDIETIRLNGGAGTAVTLAAKDVLGDLEGGSFDPGGSGGGGTFDKAPTLRVDGDSGDTLNLSGGGWHEATGSSGVPASHTLYVHEASGSSPGADEDAYVLVQNGVAVTGA